MNGRVMIVGTGNVGASIAYAIVNQRTSVKELILTDLNQADAEGEAMDLCDALAVSPSWLKIRAGDYNDVKGCDICILTAGANQKPSETRTDLLQKNIHIIREITQSIMAKRFNGIFIIVTNPVDVLSWVVWQTSGLPPEQIIGSGTVLDSARLRFHLAKALQVHPKSIHAYQIGEHGDSEFTLWSSANVGGQQITQLLSPARRQKISDSVRQEAYRIIEKKGATHYGIGACVVQIINCILNDERRVLSVSSYDDFVDAFYGFPTVVGRKGVIKQLEPELTEQEGIQLQQSINTIKANLRKVPKL